MKMKLIQPGSITKSVAALFGALILLAPEAQADSVGCPSLIDGCTSYVSYGPWKDRSCFNGFRCYIVQRRVEMCTAGPPPVVEFAWRDHGNGGAVPCSSDCVDNASCEDPQGGEGGS